MTVRRAKLEIAKAPERISRSALEDIRERVAKSRRSQGLTEHVTDSAALQRLERLRARREARGLTRTIFAATIAKATSTVDAYERDRIAPPLHVLKAMIAALGCGVGELVEAESAA